MVVQDEEFLAAVLHRPFAELVDEKGYRGRLAPGIFGRDGERVPALVREEHLEAASGARVSCCLLHIEREPGTGNGS